MNEQEGNEAVTNVTSYLAFAIVATIVTVKDSSECLCHLTFSFVKLYSIKRVYI
jgi:hypothetical protein